MLKLLNARQRVKLKKYFIPKRTIVLKNALKACKKVYLEIIVVMKTAQIVLLQIPKNALSVLIKLLFWMGDQKFVSLIVLDLQTSIRKYAIIVLIRAGSLTFRQKIVLKLALKRVTRLYLVRSAWKIVHHLIQQCGEQKISYVAKLVARNAHLKMKIFAQPVLMTIFSFQIQINVYSIVHFITHIQFPIRPVLCVNKEPRFVISKTLASGANPIIF